MSTFQQRLKDLRTGSGLTQEELGKKVGVGKMTVSQYETGSRRPDIETLEALADALNVSVDYLIGKSDITVQLVNEDDLAVLRDDSFRRLFPYFKVLNKEGAGKIESYIKDLNPKFFKQEEANDD